MARETIAELKREIDDIRADRNHLREQLADAKVQVQIMEAEVAKARKDSLEAEATERDYQLCRVILRRLGIDVNNPENFLYKPPVSYLIMDYLFQKFGASVDLPANQS